VNQPVKMKYQFYCSGQSVIKIEKEITNGIEHIGTEITNGIVRALEKRKICNPAVSKTSCSFIIFNKC